MRISYELDLNTFEAWSGAIDTLDKIKEYELINELEFLLKELYPDGMTETELNDLLWFEPNYLYETLGISEEEEV